MIKLPSTVLCNWWRLVSWMNGKPATIWKSEQWINTQSEHLWYVTPLLGVGPQRVFAIVNCPQGSHILVGARHTCKHKQFRENMKLKRNVQNENMTPYDNMGIVMRTWPWRWRRGRFLNTNTYFRGHKIERHFAYGNDFLKIFKLFIQWLFFFFSLLLTMYQELGLQPETKISSYHHSSEGNKSIKILYYTMERGRKTIEVFFSNIRVLEDHEQS